LVRKIAPHSHPSVSYHIHSYHISHHITDIKRQNHLKAGTDKPKLKVKMQSVSDDDVRKRLVEKPRFENSNFLAHLPDLWKK